MRCCSQQPGEISRSPMQETSKDFSKSRYEERMNEVKEKQLHEQFFREMEGVTIASDKSWGWLEKCHLKKRTEVLIMAAQSQFLRINAIKAKIDKTQKDPLSRLCKKNDETVNHILNEWPKLTQTEYRYTSIHGIHVMTTRRREKIFRRTKSQKRFKFECNVDQKL